MTSAIRTGLIRLTVSSAVGLLAFAEISLGGANTAVRPLIVPHVQVPLNQTQSVVYCPTFQLAWDELKALVGGPVEMERGSLLAEELNRSSSSLDRFPQGAYVAMCGRTSEGVLDRIQKALTQAFGASAPASPQGSVSNMGIIAYAHLARHLTFPRRFIRERERSLSFAGPSGEEHVQYFGVTKELAKDYGPLIRILHYVNAREFTVELRTQTEGEVIILSMMNPPRWLGDALETVRRQRELAKERDGTGDGRVEGRKADAFLAPFEVLAVPVIDLRESRSFDALCKRMLRNPGFEDWWIEVAKQDVECRMDESGAVVQSTAVVEMALGGEDPRGAPTGFRRFIFNRPFLMALWKETAEYPYLAVWVNRSDVMVPFELRKRGK